MAECMWMPDSWEKFIEDFCFTDDKEVYTNGAELIAVFRVKQMVEYYFREVEPVVHAHWEYIDFCSPNSKCSACGSLAPMDCCGDYHGERTKRCPHCGAHMDEGVKDVSENL